MEFSIRIGKEVVNAEARTHEAALLKYLTSRRRALLRVRDGAEADELSSELPRKTVVSGGGASRAYRVKWEMVGKTKFPGSRYVFSVEESGLGRLVASLWRRPPR